MAFTNAEFGTLLIIISFILLWPLRILPKVRAVMVFVGILLAGITSGLVMHLLARLTALAGHLFGTVIALAFGASVTGIAIIVALIFLVHDLHPKKQARARTYWLAVATSIAIVTATSGIAALNGLPGQVQTAITQAGG
jgi:hypothetical protein